MLSLVQHLQFWGNALILPSGGDEFGRGGSVSNRATPSSLYYATQMWVFCALIDYTKPAQPQYRRGSSQSTSPHSLVFGLFCIMKLTKCWSDPIKSNRYSVVLQEFFKKICFANKKIIIYMYLKIGEFPPTSTASSALTRTLTNRDPFTRK